ncbi:Gfo/Idh/MocA family protein [Flavobacterium sp. LB3P45]|uniref:Gfo/Idh/MocA family protein n=1 Tax=Flavobacterium fructosi TaxID=3230416 RepID=A0ABW6HI42_9FLAO
MNFILIIGLGSIGVRHLNNLIYLGYTNIIIVSKSGNIPSEFNQFSVYTDCQKAITENLISHGFICTPTSSHLDDLTILLENNIAHIYLEKPISHNLTYLDEISNLTNKCKRLVVGYDLHFDPGLIKIKELLNENQMGKVFSINATVGQYLPDWRPNQDYLKGMSAKIDKGGGVMLDLVHEFDYVRWLVGKPKNIACIFQNNPSLSIETEDVADVLIHFEGNSSGTIHLDYHQKKLVRNCMITCEKGTVFWDLTKSEVKIIRHDQEMETFSYLDFERNQRYIDSIKAFLDESKYDDRLTNFEEALVSLKMVVAAKESSISKQFIAIN